MPDQHKHSPVTFRPPEDDRAWLYAHAAETGRSIGSILSEALACHRARIEPGPEPYRGRPAGPDATLSS